MRVLLVSYYAESHLINSAAQNTRRLASGLQERGHEVRVICAGVGSKTIIQDGYLLTTLPLTSREWKHQWLNPWRQDLRIRKFALDYFHKWKPDIVYMGAWQYLSEFALEAREQGIPVIQMVHDYSIICLRQWLVDSWNQVCSGPTSMKKCSGCIRHGLSWKDRIKDLALSMPILGGITWKFIRSNRKWGIHVGRVVAECFKYMQDYRSKINAYIAQSPDVIKLLETGGVHAQVCHLVPQYIGEEKLYAYPRAEGMAGKDRPVRFVYIGRWSLEKGVNILLEAYLAAKMIPDTTLWVISRDASIASIRSQTKNRLTDNKSIEVMNNLKGAEVSRKLAQADVCIVPSLNPETGSRVVLEAYAQSVPVIASTSVGNRYVIEDGINGGIFISGDVKGLIEKIDRLANNPEILRVWSSERVGLMNKESWIAAMEKIFLEGLPG